MTWYHFDDSTISIEKLEATIRYESGIVSDLLGCVFNPELEGTLKLQIEFSEDLTETEENELGTLISEHTPDTTRYVANYRLQHVNSVGLLTHEEWFESEAGGLFSGLSKRKDYTYSQDGTSVENVTLTDYYADGAIRYRHTDSASTIQTNNGTTFVIYKEVY